MPHITRSEDGLVAVTVHRPGRAWRLLHTGEPGAVPPPLGIEVRTADPGGDAFDASDAEITNVRVSPEVVISLPDLPSVGTASGHGPVCYDLSNATNFVGLAPLWEWCCEAGVHPRSSWHTPASAWGVYSREQNSAIEDAFQAGQQDISVDVGIRTYRIVFGPDPGFARQVDDTLHKRRLVRRRLLDSSEELDRLLEPQAPVVAREQDCCPICCTNFAESAALPVLELPGCRHVFHMACAQQLADARSQCPCCRGEVDWDALGATSRGRGLS